MKPFRACLIICGEKRLERLLPMLDEAGIMTWAVVAASQSRNLSFLQNIPGRHPCQPYLVIGMAPGSVMDDLQRKIEEGRRAGILEAECLAYTWDMNSVESPGLDLDPVCDEVVDCNIAPSASVHDHTYHFTSDGSRKAFLEEPNRYIELSQSRRIGQRDVVPAGAP